MIAHSSKNSLTLRVLNGTTNEEDQSIEYFQRSQQSVVRNVTDPNMNWRSDLTPEILKEAELDDSSDESVLHFFPNGREETEETSKRGV